MGLPVHGRKGHVTIAGGTLFHIQEFTLNESTEPYEVTELAATPPTSKAFAFDGLLEYGGTINVQLDDTTQTLDAGTTGAAVFTSAEGRTWSGNIGIAGRDHTLGHGAVQTGVYTWKGNGNFTDA